MEDVDIWMNGSFVPRDEASVSVFDHGLLYGDGVFEGIRVYENVIYRLEEHIERLFESAKAIKLDIPMSLPKVKQACVQSCKRNHVEDGYIRLVVTRGEGDLGLDPDQCPEPTVFIIAADIELYPEEIYEQGLELVTAATRRNHPEAINPRIKSLNYLNNILAKMEAKQAGVQEGIMLNNEGYVVECTGDNIFVVEGDVIRTPPPHMGVLEGITRDAMMRIARDAGYTVEEEPINRYDLYVADEIFVTGTAAEALPVVRVDDRDINGAKPGPVSESLIEQFRDHVTEYGTVIS